MALSENFRDFQRLNFGPPKEVQLEHPGMSYSPNGLMTSLFVKGKVLLDQFRGSTQFYLFALTVLYNGQIL